MAERVISIRSRDNLGNRMLQYMVALALQKRIPGSRITGADLPEWDIIGDTNPDLEKFAQVHIVALGSGRALSLQAVAAACNAEPSSLVVIDDHVQRLEFLDAAETYRGIFKEAEPGDVFGPNDLVINVRAGDIRIGVAHYPLIPIGFYRFLRERTELKLVFCGQIDDSEYVSRLRASFPEARFIPSRGAVGDFQLLRSAHHLVPSVSTFSWLGAWLSRAQTIHLPLCGFLNPSHLRQIDLVPSDDVRYRFYLFPLFHGLAEQEMLRFHETLEGRWREISANQTGLLRKGAPFLTPYRADIPFNETWYLHRYPDVGEEISLGWFENPLHHYLEVGRLRGYAGTQLEAAGVSSRLPGQNIAMGKRATQSSIGQWSSGGSVEDDASIAVRGRPWENKYFHTAEEDRPWWQVDFGQVCSIRAIRVFNREGPEVFRARSAPLLFETSFNGKIWTEVLRTSADEIFGGSGGRPLVRELTTPGAGQFLRITLLKHGVLHLAEVEVYGAPVSG